MPKSFKNIQNFFPLFFHTNTTPNLHDIVKIGANGWKCFNIYTYLHENVAIVQCVAWHCVKMLNWQIKGKIGKKFIKHRENIRVNHRCIDSSLLTNLMIIFTLISFLFFFQFEFIFLPLEKISTHELPSKIKYFSMVSAPSLRGELKMFWKHPKGYLENFKN